jgi:hypothetical protein
MAEAMSTEFSEKLFGKHPLGSLSRCENNNNMYLTEISCEGQRQMELALNLL